VTPLALGLAAAVSAASFTFVSRARNSDSLAAGAVASCASSVVWLFVLRGLVVDGSLAAGVAYVLGSIVGGTIAHWLSLRWRARR
jgi:uncharacterized membrane protein YjjB (DUF3815 family)